MARAISPCNGPPTSGNPALKPSECAVEAAPLDEWSEIRILVSRTVRAGGVRLFPQVESAGTARLVRARLACVFGNQAAASAGRFASGMSSSLPDFTS